jgi:phenylpropionate dioxygenase-like ring-hydroxylating dioxygenase large terminal subunit
MNGFVEFNQGEMETVQEILSSDTRLIPEPLLQHDPSTLGAADVSTESYLSPAIHELEVERLWKRVWQWACRVEEIPKVGDHYVYEVADLSAIVVRISEGDDPGAIRGFVNACLHRGTQLRVESGNVPAFRCPFHGWTWNLDGTLQWLPCDWDFPQTKEHPETFALPAVHIGVWGGFVFVNFSEEPSESLETYLENIPSHFAHYPLDDRFIAVNVQRVMPANWKVVMGAFIEAYHSVVTHPQILAFTGDANTQYDIYGRHSRMITPFAVASPHIGGKQYEQLAIAQVLAEYRGSDPQHVALPPGVSARALAADQARTRIGAIADADLSMVSDTLMLDAIEYFVFPNFMPWAAYGSAIQYRFRPNGNDVNSAIMDVQILMPFRGQRPPAAKVHLIGSDESWTTAKQLGGLGAIFDQDTSNLARVQRGLRAAAKRAVTLGEYQEARIRHFHQTLDRYLAIP